MTDLSGVDNKTIDFSLLTEADFKPVDFA